MPASGSVDISIDVGVRLGNVPRSAVSDVQAVLGGLRRQWREDLIGVWPVETGRSLQGWQNRISGLVWILRNPVDYAEFVHLEGDTTEIWRFLEAEAERMVHSVMPEMRAIVASARLTSTGFASPRALRGPRTGPPLSGGLAGAIFRARAALNIRTGPARRARDLAALRGRTRTR